jgi:hypothetical protein
MELIQQPKLEKKREEDIIETLQPEIGRRLNESSEVNCPSTVRSKRISDNQLSTLQRPNRFKRHNISREQSSLLCT